MAGIKRKNGVIFVDLRNRFFMNNEKLKKELHALIDNTEDEELLNMVKEDIIAYQPGERSPLDHIIYYTGNPALAALCFADQHPPRAVWFF